MAAMMILMLHACVTGVCSLLVSLVSAEESPSDWHYVMPGLKKLVNATMHVPMRSAFASLQKTGKYGCKGSSRTKCRRIGYLRNELMSKSNELLNSRIASRSNSQPLHLPQKLLPSDAF
jgi:hypothetical protein